MKKKLESDLISIAHRILKLKGKEDVLKMHAEVSALYEKLTVLKFAHENFEDDMPTIGSDSSFFGMLDKAFNNTVSDNIEVEDRIYVNLDEVEDDIQNHRKVRDRCFWQAVHPVGQPADILRNGQDNSPDQQTDSRLPARH